MVIAQRKPKASASLPSRKGTAQNVGSHRIFGPKTVEHAAGQSSDLTSADGRARSAGVGVRPWRQTCLLFYQNGLNTHVLTAHLPASSLKPADQEDILTCWFWQLLICFHAWFNPPRCTTPTSPECPDPHSGSIAASKQQCHLSTFSLAPIRFGSGSNMLKPKTSWGSAC